MDVLDVSNHEQVARLLLENSAAVNHENKDQVTALNMACEDQHEACALLLLHAGAEVRLVIIVTYQILNPQPSTLTLNPQPSTQRL